ncbi:MAG: hypothetical protein V2I31_07770, partial [Mariniphaga sp.]|nr:hypothetical protein [Mariniphaga sp.]
SNEGGVLVAILWIVTIVLAILSGVISWNMIEPESFIGFIGFLLVWSVLSSVGHFLAIGLVAWIQKL